ncbi:hypothetical protein COP2_027583 [Malus domestica]
MTLKVSSNHEASSVITIVTSNIVSVVSFQGCSCFLWTSIQTPLECVPLRGLKRHKVDICLHCHANISNSCCLMFP